jgi:hypothetical protein
METTMLSTELLVRPLRHPWESPVAYVFRLASLNCTDHARLAWKVVEDGVLPHERLDWKVHSYWPVLSSAFNNGGRPHRLVCPYCLRENRPDSLDEYCYPYLEYCLFHTCLPLSNCPQCRADLVYSRGTYERCECGFQLSKADAPAASAHVRRLYLGIAAGTPAGVEPRSQELEGHSLETLNARLGTAWRFLWKDLVLGSGEATKAALHDQPTFGMRWSAVSTVHGLTQCGRTDDEVVTLDHPTRQDYANPQRAFSYR